MFHRLESLNNAADANFRYGASGVWVGTRFVASVEAGASKKHKELVLSAGYDDVVRTLIYSGRPMSVRKTPYVEEWYGMVPSGKNGLLITIFREMKRASEIQELISQGKVPHDVELQAHPEKSVQGLSCTYFPGHFTIPLFHCVVQG